MATGQSDAAAAIRTLDEEFTRNANAGDAERLAEAFYSDDAYLLPPNHPIVSGRSQIRDFFQGMIEAGVGELAIESLKIDVSGDLAYNVGKYSLGKPAPDTGKFVEVHRRQPDGSWRCVADIFNSDQPAA